MSYLTRSSENNKHKHVVYIREDGTGSTSKDKGHFHEVLYLPPQEEIVDPQTGQIIQEATPGQLVLAEADGHTHEITDEIFVPKQAVERKGEDSDEEILKQVYDWYFDAKENDQQKLYLSDAENCEGYYHGDGQWSEADKMARKSEGRPAHTINKINPKIKALVGYEFQNGSSIKYMAKEDGDVFVADLLNVLSSHVSEINDYRFHRNEAFEDEVVTGRGNLLLYIDNIYNPEGEIVIERQPYDSVYYGEYKRKDSADCQYLARDKWISENELLLLAPDKEKEIKSGIIYNFSGIISYRDDYKRKTGALIDKSKKKVKLVKVQRKEYQKREVISNEDDKFYMDGIDGRLSDLDLDDKDKKAILTIEGFDSIKKLVPEIWEMHVAGNLLLKDVKLPFSSLTCVPCHADFRGGKIKGKVIDLIGPQDEVNKRRSTMTDIASRIANLRTFYESSTFEDETEENRFLDEGAMPGYTGKVSNIEKRPQIDQPPPFPRDLVTLEQLSTADLNEISNINPELMGVGSDARSAVLYVERKNSALLGNEYCFQGLSLGQKQIGRLQLEGFRVVYTPERVYKIAENRNKRFPGQVSIGGVPFEKFPKDEVMRIWQQADLSQYDVAVSEQDESPTKMAADYKVWAMLAQAGVPGIGGEFLIELNPDLPPDQKQKLKEIAQREAQMQMQMQMAKIQGELDKTAMANQQGGQMPQGQA